MRRQYQDRPPLPLCDTCGHFLESQSVHVSTDGGQSFGLLRIQTCLLRRGHTARRCKVRKEFYN